MLELEKEAHLLKRWFKYNLINVFPEKFQTDWMTGQVQLSIDHR